MSRLGPQSQPTVIPSTEGRPLRTFIFLTHDKVCIDEYDIQIYFAESKLALCEWWCAGGKSTDTWYFNRKCKKLKPHQLLELLEDGYPTYDAERFELLEASKRLKVIPTTPMIRLELNQYLSNTRLDQYYHRFNANLRR